MFGVNPETYGCFLMVFITLELSDVRLVKVEHNFSESGTKERKCSENGA